MMTEMLAKEPLFYGTRRIHREGTGQSVRSFRACGIDGRHVQDRHQPSVDAEDRRAGTAQIYVPRPEMLASVDGDGALFGNASADSVRALDLLGPDAAEPGPPVFEFARLRIFAAMLDRDPGGITEQDGVSGLANDLVQPVDLLLCCQDEVAERLARVFQLTRREDARRPAVDGIDAVSVRGTLPGCRQLLDVGRRCRSLRNRIDAFRVLRGSVNQAR